MKSRVMDGARAVAVTVAIISLVSSDSGAAARRAAAFQAAPIPNLAAYWPMDTAPGGVTPDTSGNGNNGTLVNGVAIDTVNRAPVPAGNVGSASYPTLAANQNINVPDSASLSLTGSISVAAWIRTNLTAPAANQQEIVGKFDGPSPYYNGYFLRLNTNNYLSWAIVPSTGTTVGISSAPRAISTGAWHHVAGTYNATTGAMTMYIDGAADATTAPPQPTPPGPPGDGTSNLNIGENGSNEFNGNIDEVRIYSRALTAAQVNTLFTGVQPPPTGLTATPGPASITLNWTAAAAASSYNVYRSLSMGGPFVLIANTALTTYTDMTVTNPTQYWYQVTAVGALESAPAGPVSAVPQSILPKTTTSGSSNNLAHRCGCDTVAGPAGPLALGAALLAALLGLGRRRRGVR